MSIRNLPYKDIPLASGIATNLAPNAAAGRYVRSSKNIDGYALFRGVGKVPGSERVSDDHGKPVASLHQFEFTDLDLVRKRRQLSLADGKLWLVESDKSLTELATGFTDEPLAALSSLDRLYLTGPNQRGLSTGGVKYDGTNVRSWGIHAPGQEKTTLLALDDSTSWTAGTDCSVEDSDVTKDGGGSVQLNKTGTAGTSAAMTRSWSKDLSSIPDDTVAVWLFLPYGVLQKLSASGDAVEIKLGTSGYTNADIHRYDVGELFPGWNLLSLVLTAPDTTAGSGATLSNITDISLGLTVLTASTTLSGILWERLHHYDQGSPTLAEGSSGSVTGTKTYRITYIDENGVESNAGSPSDPITVDEKEVDLTNIPVSSNNGVIARRIYRDDSDDNVWRFVAEIPNNVDTTYTDTSDDTSLSLTTPPIAGDSSLDSTPPGRLVDTIIHHNRIVGISAEDEFTLIISDVGLPEAARIVDQIQLEERLRKVQSHALGTLVYGQDRLFLLSGDGVNRPFRIDEVNPQLGTDGRRTVARQKGTNFTIREGEVYTIARPSDPWLINTPVLDQWRSIADREDTFLIHDRSRFRFLAFAKSTSGGSYDTIWVLQYGALALQQISGEGSGVDPLDSRTAVWWKLEMPSAVDPQCAEVVETSSEIAQLWVGGADGYIYRIQSPDVIDWASGTSTAAVEAELECWEVPLGEDSGGRGTPRFLQLNAEATVASTWTFTVTLLDDADGREIASNSFNVTIGPGATPKIVPIPGLKARGEWCRIKIANANAGEDGIFRPPIRLYYIPRVDFRGPRS